MTKTCKKMAKKMLAVVLAAVIIASCLSVSFSTFAANQFAVTEDSPAVPLYVGYKVKLTDLTGITGIGNAANWQGNSDDSVAKIEDGYLVGLKEGEAQFWLKNGSAPVWVIVRDGGDTPSYNSDDFKLVDLDLTDESNFDPNDWQGVYNTTGYLNGTFTVDPYAESRLAYNQDSQALKLTGPNGGRATVGIIYKNESKKAMLQDFNNYNIYATIASKSSGQYPTIAASVGVFARAKMAAELTNDKPVFGDKKALLLRLRAYGGAGIFAYNNENPYALNGSADDTFYNQGLRNAAHLMVGGNANMVMTPVGTGRPLIERNIEIKLSGKDITYSLDSYDIINTGYLASNSDKLKNITISAPVNDNPPDCSASNVLEGSVEMDSSSYETAYRNNIGNGNETGTFGFTVGKSSSLWIYSVQVKAANIAETDGPAMVSATSDPGHDPEPPATRFAVPAGSPAVPLYVNKTLHVNQLSLEIGGEFVDGEACEWAPAANSTGKASYDNHVLTGRGEGIDLYDVTYGGKTITVSVIVNKQDDDKFRIYKFDAYKDDPYDWVMANANVDPAAANSSSTIFRLGGFQFWTSNKVDKGSFTSAKTTEGTKPAFTIKNTSTSAKGLTQAYFLNNEGLKYFSDYTVDADLSFIGKKIYAKEGATSESKLESIGLLMRADMNDLCYQNQDYISNGTTVLTNDRALALRFRNYGGVAIGGLNSKDTGTTTPFLYDDQANMYYTAANDTDAAALAAKLANGEEGYVWPANTQLRQGNYDGVVDGNPTIVPRNLKVDLVGNGIRYTLDGNTIFDTINKDNNVYGQFAKLNESTDTEASTDITNNVTRDPMDKPTDITFSGNKSLSNSEYNTKLNALNLADTGTIAFLANDQSEVLLYNLDIIPANIQDGVTLPEYGTVSETVFEVPSNSPIIPIWTGYRVTLDCLQIEVNGIYYNAAELDWEVDSTGAAANVAKYVAPADATEDEPAGIYGKTVGEIRFIVTDPNGNEQPVWVFVRDRLNDYEPGDNTFHEDFTLARADFTQGDSAFDITKWVVAEVNDIPGEDGNFKGFEGYSSATVNDPNPYNPPAYHNGYANGAFVGINEGLSMTKVYDLTAKKEVSALKLASNENWVKGTRIAVWNPQTNYLDDFADYKITVNSGNANTTDSELAVSSIGVMARTTLNKNAGLGQVVLDQDVKSLMFRMRNYGGLGIYSYRGSNDLDSEWNALLDDSSILWVYDDEGKKVLPLRSTVMPTLADDEAKAQWFITYCHIPEADLKIKDSDAWDTTKFTTLVTGNESRIDDILHDNCERMWLSMNDEYITYWTIDDSSVLNPATANSTWVMNADPVDAGGVTPKNYVLNLQGNDIQYTLNGNTVFDSTGGCIRRGGVARVVNEPSAGIRFDDSANNAAMAYCTYDENYNDNIQAKKGTVGFSVNYGEDLYIFDFKVEALNLVDLVRPELEPFEETSLEYDVHINTRIPLAQFDENLTHDDCRTEAYQIVDNQILIFNHRTNDDPIVLKLNEDTNIQLFVCDPGTQLGTTGHDYPASPVKFAENYMRVAPVLEGSNNDYVVSLPDNLTNNLELVPGTLQLRTTKLNQATRPIYLGEDDGISYPFTVVDPTDFVLFNSNTNGKLASVDENVWNSTILGSTIRVGSNNLEDPEALKFRVRLPGIKRLYEINEYSVPAGIYTWSPDEPPVEFKAFGVLLIPTVLLENSGTVEGKEFKLPDEVLKNFNPESSVLTIGNGYQVKNVPIKVLEQATEKYSDAWIHMSYGEYGMLTSGISVLDVKMSAVSYIQYIDEGVTKYSFSSQQDVSYRDVFNKVYPLTAADDNLDEVISGTRAYKGTDGTVTYSFENKTGYRIDWVLKDKAGETLESGHTTSAQFALTKTYQEGMAFTATLKDWADSAVIYKTNTGAAFDIVVEGEEPGTDDPGHEDPGHEEPEPTGPAADPREVKTVKSYMVNGSLTTTQPAAKITTADATDAPTTHSESTTHMSNLIKVFKTNKDNGNTAAPQALGYTINETITFTVEAYSGYKLKWELYKDNAAINAITTAEDANGIGGEYISYNNKSAAENSTDATLYVANNAPVKTGIATGQTTISTRMPNAGTVRLVCTVYPASASDTAIQNGTATPIKYTRSDTKKTTDAVANLCAVADYQNIVQALESAGLEPTSSSTYGSEEAFINTLKQDVQTQAQKVYAAMNTKSGSEDFYDFIHGSRKVGDTKTFSSTSGGVTTNVKVKVLSYTAGTNIGLFYEADTGIKNSAHNYNERPSTGTIYIPLTTGITGVEGYYTSWADQGTGATSVVTAVVRGEGNFKTSNTAPIVVFTQPNGEKQGETVNNEMVTASQDGLTNPKDSYAYGMIFRDYLGMLIGEYIYGKEVPSGTPVISVSGTSQGGFQAMFVAALEEKTSEIVTLAAWMCSVGQEKSNYILSGFMPYCSADWYFSTVSAAKYIAAQNRTSLKAKIKTNLGDTTAPISGEIALFNALKANSNYKIWFTSNQAKFHNSDPLEEGGGTADINHGASYPQITW